MNQFTPPDPAPTARLAGEVAAELVKRGHEVTFIGDRADYRGGKTMFGSRMLRELFSLMRLQWSLLRAPRADAVVFLTSPPLLPVVSLAGRLRHLRAKWIHWAMDLYPDVAVALGEVRDDSLLHRFTAALMRRVYRQCDLIIALDEAMKNRIASPAPCEIVAPWPSEMRSPSTGPTRETAGPFTWLYSGNLGRAHEWETLLEAQSLLEAEGHAIDLVFQGGGQEIGKARQRADELGLRRCFWRDYAPESELPASLLAADALIVTQRPETAGCLWPSKLALVRLLERPIIWVGPDGPIAEDLRAGGHCAVAPGEVAALAEFLAGLTASPRKTGPVEEEWLDRVAKLREVSIDRVATAIEESLAEPRSVS